MHFRLRGSTDAIRRGFEERFPWPYGRIQVGILNTIEEGGMHIVEKKFYNTPRLIVYGDVREITQNLARESGRPLASGARGGRSAARSSRVTNGKRDAWSLSFNH
jgi:hypothetical protein